MNTAIGDATATITIIDDDESPVFTSSASLTADENQTAVDTIVASDGDGDTVTYSITGGADAASFAINSTTGVLTFVTAPDYETKASYALTVTADDGYTNTAEQNITVTINNLNDNSPVITSAETFAVDENETSVGSLSATDADGDTVTFTLGGTDADSFSLNSPLAFVEAPDFETKSSYTITVIASDGTNTVEQEVTITINNLNDNVPVITSLDTFTIPENVAELTTLSATDADGDALTFTLSGTDASSFTLNSTTGAFAFAAAPDFETKKSYAATLNVSDGSFSVSQDLTFSITNVEEVPVFTTNGQYTADENQYAIGTASAYDPDGGSVTFTFGDGNSVIQVTEAGVLSFVTDHFREGAPDYEGLGPYPFDGDYNTAVGCSGNGDDNYILIATDANGNSTRQNICVQINNLNEAPVFTSAASFTIDENTSAVGTLAATDDDTDDTVTFSLSGTDAASLTLTVKQVFLL